jgi:glycogen operon protein
VAYYLDGKPQQDVDIYVMISAYWEPLRFTVQEQASDRRAWKRAIDTSLESPLDIAEPGSELVLGTPDYVVTPRSVVVLVR